MPASAWSSPEPSPLSRCRSAHALLGLGDLAAQLAASLLELLADLGELRPWSTATRPAARPTPAAWRPPAARRAFAGAAFAGGLAAALAGGRRGGAGFAAGAAAGGGLRRRRRLGRRRGLRRRGLRRCRRAFAGRAALAGAGAFAGGGLLAGAFAGSLARRGRLRRRGLLRAARPSSPAEQPSSPAGRLGRSGLLRPARLLGRRSLLGRGRRLLRRGRPSWPGSLLRGRVPPSSPRRSLLGRAAFLAAGAAFFAARPSWPGGLLRRGRGRLLAPAPPSSRPARLLGRAAPLDRRAFFAGRPSSRRSAWRWTRPRRPFTGGAAACERVSCCGAFRSGGAAARRGRRRRRGAGGAQRTRPRVPRRAAQADLPPRSSAIRSSSSHRPAGATPRCKLAPIVGRRRIGRRRTRRQRGAPRPPLSDHRDVEPDSPSPGRPTSVIRYGRRDAWTTR